MAEKHISFCEEMLGTVRFLNACWHKTDKETRKLTCEVSIDGHIAYEGDSYYDVLLSHKMGMMANFNRVLDSWGR